MSRTANLLVISLALIVSLWGLCRWDQACTATLVFEGVVEFAFPVRLSLGIAALMIAATIGLRFLRPKLIPKVRSAALISLGIFAVLVIAAAGRRLDMVGVLTQSMRLATPIMLGAMAGLLSERCGVVNIAIEGMMLLGACIGYVAAIVCHNSVLGVFVAIGAGAAAASLHALLSLKFRTDQIISGTVINILAVGVTGYIRRVFLLTTDLTFPGVLPTISVPLLHKVPILGAVFFNQQPIVYAALLLAVTLQFSLYQTRWGLRTRACGEHPLAAATVGINVIARRAVNVLLAGGVAGLAGAWFSLETTGVFEDLMTNGKGFIALAAMIFGRWTPGGAVIGAFLFGFSDALQIKLQVLGVDIPYQFLGMLPYILTMIVLAGFMGKAAAPAAIGKPFPER